MSRFLLNPAARSGRQAPGLFDADEYRRVAEFFDSRPDLLPTPLRSVPTLASQLGMQSIQIKDESARFGLNAFKVLGVCYAVDRLVSAGEVRSDSCLVCATEGNHGRAVARIARERRLPAKVYIRAGANPQRTRAIAAEGAEVVLVDGTYDQAVKRMALDAERHRWTIISDTAWARYEQIPRWIMAGYTRLLDECERQWGSSESRPDVVLVQAGVGGLACSVVSWLSHRYGNDRPYTIVCEPEHAACVLESTRAGHPVALSGPLDTMMASLRCGEVSTLAWPSVAALADAFVAIPDRFAQTAMVKLANPAGSDERVSAGPAGACGLGALLALLGDEPDVSSLRRAAGLGRAARVLMFNTEAEEQ